MTCKTCKTEIKRGPGNLNYVNMGESEIYCAKCWNEWVAKLNNEGRNYRGWPTIDTYQ